MAIKGYPAGTMVRATMTFATGDAHVDTDRPTVRKGRCYRVVGSTRDDQERPKLYIEAGPRNDRRVYGVDARVFTVVGEGE